MKIVEHTHSTFASSLLARRQQIAMIVMRVKNVINVKNFLSVSLQPPLSCVPTLFSGAEQGIFFQKIVIVTSGERAKERRESYIVTLRMITMSMINISKNVDTRESFHSKLTFSLSA